MSDLTVIVDGTPIDVRLGESTEIAAAAAASAEAAAADAEDFKELAEAAALTLPNVYASTAAGLAAVAANETFWVYDSGAIKLYRDVAGSAVLLDSLPLSALLAATYATKASPAFTGQASFVTNSNRIGITNEASALTPEALTHIYNNGATTNGLRVESHWTGSTGAPYTNNDNVLLEVFNTVLSASANQSWGNSVVNYTGTIPAGVTDSGHRTSVQGWSVSVAGAGTHEGTMAMQVGVLGRAGFQGPGSAATAVVQQAIAVRGEIWNDSAGATIEEAFAGTFVSTASTGTIERNVGVYSEVANGTVSNHSFYSPAGVLFNSGQIRAGSDTLSQSSSAVSARKAGNAYEFGHPDGGGYGSNIGATLSAGYPFLAFCGEVATGDTFRTRGKLGAVVWSDLAGALVFSRLTTATSASQSMTESARFTAAGHFETIGNIVATGSAVVRAGNTAAETSAKVIARVASNALEFGHPSTGGYVSTIGATASLGYPFLAFNAEAATGDTFTTRGRLGVVIRTDNAGKLLFQRLTNSNAAGQTPTPSLAITASGRLQMVMETPASAGATGDIGSIVVDANYIYVCTAANTWKRVAIATW